MHVHAGAGAAAQAIEADSAMELFGAWRPAGAPRPHDVRMSWRALALPACVQILSPVGNLMCPCNSEGIMNRVLGKGIG